MKPHVYLFGLLALGGLVFIGCTEDQVPADTNYIYTPPVDLGDGLEVSDLVSEGFDPLPIRIMMDSIDAGFNGVFHSLLIFRNDKLVLEEYRNGILQNDLQPMYSVTKSIASAVIGIAIDKGYIAGPDATSSNLLAHFTQLNWTTDTEQITLENFLTMSSGYQWNETSTPYDDPANSHYQMMASNDWIKYIIELPLVRTPGTTFHYNTGTSTLFSVFISESTGINFDDFARTNLLLKLGIDQYSWYYMPGDYPATGGSYGGIYLRSRDMAKFGLLYLNQGIWQNERIISRQWVDQSLAPHINVTVDGSYTYGYQWWRNEQVKGKGGQIIAVPYAVGHGGQYIFLINAYDILVIITAPFDNPGKTTPAIFKMIEDYILSSIT